jgi:hypothetical protein
MKIKHHVINPWRLPRQVKPRFSTGGFKDQVIRGALLQRLGIKRSVGAVRIDQQYRSTNGSGFVSVMIEIPSLSQVCTYLVEQYRHSLLTSLASAYTRTVSSPYPWILKLVR